MARYWTGILTLVAVMAIASQADASVVFSGSSGGLSASATFSLSNNGKTLTILLTNTDSATLPGAPDVPSEVLSGLFFNLGTSTFTPVSATVTSGAIVQTTNCDLSPCAGKTDVGGEWSYASGGASWLSGTTQGIASSGYLNANTSSGNFGGTNYEGPPSGALNGIEFGMVPLNWADGTGNNGLDKEALIAGTVKFVLDLPQKAYESDIKNVYFTYGTSAGEGTVGGGTTNTPTTSTTTGNPVPEPTLLSMLGLALAGAAYKLRRTRGEY